MSPDVIAPPVRHVGLIGNFPPRRCGLATFTADLHSALRTADPGLALSTVAMTDPGAQHSYPGEVGYEIAQDDPRGYIAAAEHINALNPDVVCLQHEFGIFGGPAGDHVLSLVERLRAPVVTTLHTVLTAGNADQRRVMSALADASSRLVVMTEMGRDILARDMGVAKDKIAVIPHGIPDLPFLDPAFEKHSFGLEGRKVALTFGLLSPGKGIEMMIAALPELVRRHPDLVYVVLGATHPHLLAREGEAYREDLEAQVRKLGLEHHVRFVNEFVDAPTLQAWLSASDIYVTPYLSEAQITSGTLAYSVGLGKAVVSTPYWHAQELLAGERGELVPFASPDALAEAVGSLLTDSRRRDRLRRNAYQAGRSMTWPVVAESYIALFAQARLSERQAQGLVRLRTAAPPAPEPNMAAVARMTDGCGMLQHSRSTVADRRHGYCLDDNARALMLAAEFDAEGLVDSRPADLAKIYASFVDYAWDEAAGRFRNFMDYDRHWLETEGSQDSFGRGLWALGRTVRVTRDHGLKLWATALADKVMAESSFLESPRAEAFAALGLADWLAVYPGHRPARRLLEIFSGRLLERLRSERRDDWVWFERVLAYDNARLPEALLRAAATFERKDMRDEALAALTWLVRCQTAPAGHFRPVGTESFGHHYLSPKPFDQQPLEAWATMDACATAYAATGQRHWLEEAEKAFAWYLGSNDLGLRLATPDGGCYDGLQVDRVNLNQGAESILAYQFAALAALRYRAASRGELGPTAVAGNDSVEAAACS